LRSNIKAAIATPPEIEPCRVREMKGFAEVRSHFGTVLRGQLDPSGGFRAGRGIAKDRIEPGTPHQGQFAGNSQQRVEIGIAPAGHQADDGTISAVEADHVQHHVQRGLQQIGYDRPGRGRQHVRHDFSRIDARPHLAFFPRGLLGHRGDGPALENTHLRTAHGPLNILRALVVLLDRSGQVEQLANGGLINARIGRDACVVCLGRVSFPGSVPVHLSG
jgi:hypothetical protein